MDVIVLVIILVFELILCMLGFMGNKAGWAVFPLFGGMIGAVGALALYTDGNLTQNGTTIAAANANFVSDFNAIEMIPVAIALTCLMIAMRRIFKI